MADDGPILIAYDGSPAARAALARAATLFPGRAAVIATVWEPGLAGVIPDPGGMGGPATPVDLDVVEEVDDAFANHASSVAAEGAERAQSAGLVAEAVSTQDDSNVAETLAELADQHEAAIVVVGSRGLSGIKARLLGSTSESVLHHCRRPVLVVRDD